MVARFLGAMSDMASAVFRNLLMFAVDQHNHVGIAVGAVRPSRSAAVKDGPDHVLSVRNPLKEPADGVLSVLIDTTGTRLGQIYQERKPCRV